jgi:hypothetical protein
LLFILDTKKDCDKMTEERKERKERKKKERTPLSVLQPDGTIKPSTAIDLQSAAKSPMASGSAKSLLKKNEVKKHTLY